MRAVRIGTSNGLKRTARRKVKQKKPRGPLPAPSYDSPKSMMVVISSSKTSCCRPSSKPYHPSWLPFNSPPFMPYGTSRSRLLGKTCRNAPASSFHLEERGSDDLQHQPNS